MTQLCPRSLPASLAESPLLCVLMRLKIGDAPSLGNLFEIADLRRWTVTALGEVGAGLVGFGPQVQHLAVGGEESSSHFSTENTSLAPRPSVFARGQVVVMTKLAAQGRDSCSER